MSSFFCSLPSTAFIPALALPMYRLFAALIAVRVSRRYSVIICSLMHFYYILLWFSARRLSVGLSSPLETGHSEVEEIQPDESVLI